MPAGKSSQSNAMLYTVITFVGLFIVTTAAAIWFYVKAEEYRTQRATMEEKISELANSRERSTLSKKVGKPLKKESYMGTMLSYLDDMVSAITGQACFIICNCWPRAFGITLLYSSFALLISFSLSCWAAFTSLKAGFTGSGGFTS